MGEAKRISALIYEETTGALKIYSENGRDPQDRYRQGRTSTASVFSSSLSSGGEFDRLPPKKGQSLVCLFVLSPILIGIEN